MFFSSSHPYWPPGRQRPAFTLVELMVVASVFSLTMLVGTAIFTSVQTRQSELLRRQRLVADGRYVLETIARTARLEAVDYRYYYTAGLPDASATTGPSSPGSTLVTRNEVNTQTCFRWDSVGEQIQIGTNCQTNPPPLGWKTITPSDVRVTNFRIWILPRSNPYAPVPQASSDCRANGGSPGFNSASGICRCRSSGSGFATDCFNGQQCVYPLADQTANNNGQGLCTDSQSTAVICQPGLNTCNGGPKNGLGCVTNDDCRACYCRDALVQPQVTIYLATESRNAPSGAKARATLQTTVVSRAYGR